MTPIQDTVAKLRDQRQRLDQQFAAAIESLLALNNSLTVAEQAYAQPDAAEDRALESSRPPTSSPVAAPKTASPGLQRPHPVSQRSPRPLPDGSLLDRVYRTVRSAGPATAVRIGELLGIPRTSASSVLKALRARGLVTLDGQTHHAQWAIVARRPQVDHVSPDDVEVVWSGSKERSGEAAGLSRVTGRLS